MLYNNNNIYFLKMTEKQSDIIKAILRSDFDAFETALTEDPNSVNSVHDDSFMNAAMLCAHGQMPNFLERLMQDGNFLDFTYTDGDGHDLLYFAFSALDDSISNQIIRAYERFAPHIINNPPAPEL